MNQDISAIIDCPRCKARYALSPEMAEAIETPFHCSMCDHLFSGQAQIVEAPTQVAESTPTEDTSYEVASEDLPPDVTQKITPVSMEDLEAHASEPTEDSTDEETVFEVSPIEETQPELATTGEVLDNDEIQNLISSIPETVQAEAPIDEIDSGEALSHVADDEPVIDAFLEDAHEPAPEILAEEASEEVATASETSTDVAAQVFDIPSEEQQEETISDFIAQATEVAESLEEESIAQEEDVPESKVHLSDPIPAETPTVEITAEERTEIIDQQLDLGLSELSQVSQQEPESEEPTVVQDFDSPTSEFHFEEEILTPEEELQVEAGLNKLEREKIELAQEKAKTGNLTAIPDEKRTTRESDFTETLTGPIADFAYQNQSKPLSLGFLCTPIFIFLGLLGGAGYFLSQETNPLAVKIANLMAQQGPQVAPAGLRIRNAKFERVELSSGDSVPVISGTLFNDSSETFKAVLLEGVLFGKDGTPHRQLKTNAGSLSGNLKDYTLDMIRAQQAKRPSRRYELSPGEKQKFSIAMPGAEIESSRFYTARVYSVQS